MLSTISTKIIKPVIPTPSTQRWHKLSFADGRLLSFYMPFVFFYPESQSIGPKQVSNLVSNSLSKTLSYYYPWAGTRRQNATIECDDHGAEFLEVQINSPMDKVVNHPDSNVRDLTFPQGDPWVYGMDRALIVSQLSHFDCGGIALGVSLSHAIGDASSAYCFLRDWAALARSSNTSPSPYFLQDYMDGEGPLPPPDLGSDRQKNVQKKFIFTPRKLSALKSSIGLQTVTSNEAVNALIYKCAASSANSGSFKSSQLVQMIDLRGILSPPLPPNTIGNLASGFSSSIYDKEEQLTLPKIVTDIRKSKNKLSPKECARETLDANTTSENIYFSSNISKFPFLQDLDFGFGKPIAVSAPKGPFSKVIQMIRRNDGGIEALVNLNEEEMRVFEHDKQLLQFATPINGVFSYEQEQQRA